MSYFLISCSLLILSNLLHKQNSKLRLLLYLRLGLVSVWRNLGFSIGKEDIARFLMPQSVLCLSKYSMVSVFTQPWVPNSHHPMESYVIRTKLLAHKRHLSVCSSKAKAESKDQLGTNQFDTARDLSVWLSYVPRWMMTSDTRKKASLPISKTVTLASSHRNYQAETVAKEVTLRSPGSPTLSTLCPTNPSAKRRRSLCLTI